MLDRTGVLQSGNIPAIARRVLGPVTLFALRGANTFAKFLLAIYTARYLGLAELGIFGLLTAAATAGPPLAGFGTIDWVMRRIVPLGPAEALPLIATRACLPIVVHAVVQPIAWLVNAALGAPVPWHFVFLMGMILVLDGITSDVQDMLIARGHAVFAYVLFFFRAGLWPLVVIAGGWLFPSTRSLETILFGWLGGLAMVFATLAIALARDGRFRLLSFDWLWLKQGIAESRPFYVKDLSTAASLYLDRLLISLFLGLELTGVYTLFWSVTNFVHNLATFGIVQAQISKLIAAAAQDDGGAMRALERRLQIETLTWTAVLALAASIAMPFLLHVIDRPLLQENLAIYWLVLAACFVRIGADSYGFMMLALHRDREIAVVAVAGALLSALLNLALVPTLGLVGAGLAYFLAGAAMLVSRYRLSHRALRP